MESSTEFEILNLERVSNLKDLEVGVQRSSVAGGRSIELKSLKKVFKINRIFGRFFCSGLSVSRSVDLSVCRSVCQSVGRSVGLSVRRSVCLSVGQSVCRSIGQSVCRSVCRALGLSVSRSVSLSVSLLFF